MKQYFLLFSVFALLFRATTFAKEPEQQTVQALASLLCYVNQNTDESVEEKIVFEEEDLESLWRKAAEIEDDKYELALTEYKNWKFTEEKEEAKNSLKNCEELLSDLWVDACDCLSAKEEEKEIQLAKKHFYAMGNIFNNPLLNAEVLSTIQPFLLADDNPIAPIADKIFSERVTFDRKSLKKGGFTILFTQPRSFIVVAKHPELKQHLVKLYYDTELRKKQGCPGWKWFSERCIGAAKIRAVLTNNNIQHFAVPNKYIYVLPPSTAPKKASKVDPKPVVLIVDDMKLASKKSNFDAWKNKMTPEVLNELYIIMTNSNGGSYRPDNIPYTRKGQFAFIDTEYAKRLPDLRQVRNYLSGKSKAYWEALIVQGGPK